MGRWKNNPRLWSGQRQPAPVVDCGISLRHAGYADLLRAAVSELCLRRHLRRKSAEAPYLCLDPGYAGAFHWLKPTVCEMLDGLRSLEIEPVILSGEIPRPRPRSHSNSGWNLLRVTVHPSKRRYVFSAGRMVATMSPWLVMASMTLRRWRQPT
jgi:hypothetical protein